MTGTPAHGPTITDGLAGAAARAPHAAAVYLPDGRPGRGATGWRAVTNAQLWERSRAIAAGLSAAGLRPGDRCVLLVPPTASFFAVVIGMLEAGVVPVLVDPGIGRHHLRACLDEADPVGFVGTPKAHAARLVLRWAPRARHLVVVDAPGAASRLLRRRRPHGVTSLDRIERLGAGGTARRGSGAGSVDGTAAILFTSGSTGPPKGVEYTRQTFSAQIAALRDLYDLGPEDVQVATFPPFALFGPALGMTTVVPRMDPTRPADVDPTDIVEAVESFGATVMFASPALLDTVSAWADPRGVRLPRLRLVMTAGAPVSRRIVAATSAMLGDHARLVTPYGATEALPVASIDHRELLDVPTSPSGGRGAAGAPGGPAAGARPPGARPPGPRLRGQGVCVGRPAPGVDVAIMRITDDPVPALDETDLLPTSEIGEIVVRGAVVTASYFARPAATAVAKTRWNGTVAHRMGDVGHLDDTGRLWFCGRKAHLVHTAAGRIAPVPVEVVFNDHPWVARSALLGIGAPGRQRPCLAVELAPGAPTASDVVTELRRLAAGDERARPVEEIRVHPRFPVDIRHNAKIDYGALADWWRQADAP